MIKMRICYLAVLASVFSSNLPAAEAKPNVVLIVADNLGYGDVGCFGSTVNRTPNLDRMAAEGIKLTSFCVASSVCTPSRAAFMTGCYPARVSMEMSGTRRVVLQPVAQKGLAPGEITVAEILKRQGYATTCIGKWHLGDQLPFLPTRQGFDSWLGVPYSEDMIPTTAPRLGEMWPPVPLVRDEEVIDAPVDPNTLTARYTDEALRFIRRNRDKSFFLYLPHAVPGSSQEAFASAAFRAKSKNGTYAACVEELDWSAGEILRCLKEEGLDDKTVMVWTSDNGAFQNRRAEPYGKNTPLRGTGGTAYEGGFRVPCIVRWPGKIPAGTTSNELVTSMDLLPTVARLAGAESASDRMIDGKDVWPILSAEEGATSPHTVFYYYRISQLRAVRSGKWKLHLPVNTFAARPSARARFEELQLYDLENDLSESINVAEEQPQVVEKLTALAAEGRINLGDIGLLGKEQRPAGWIDDVRAMRLPGLPSDRWFPTDAIPLIAPGAGFGKWRDDALQGWRAVSSVALDVEDSARLVAATIEGDAAFHNTADDPSGKTAAYLVSAHEFGDIEVHIEFLMTRGSNSGVYLMGRYEIQLFDSHDVADRELEYGHCGGVYQRWDEGRNPKGFEGVAPKTNASRPTGEWQSLDISFRTPRFDATGRKIQGACFVRVSHNGVVIHENVTCSGPTRAARFTDEAPKGPLVLQGDHGPVAFRNLWLRPTRPVK